MSNELIFYTQIGSIFVFVITVFVLYKLLVTQKDAIIELLRERIAFQKERAAVESQDVLAESLSKRIRLLSDELERLNSDKETNAELITKKENELAGAKNMYERLQRLILHTSGMSVSYFCPICEEPTIESAECKLTFHNRQPDFFRVTYRCGYSEINGSKASECHRGR